MNNYIEYTCIKRISVQKNGIIFDFEKDEKYNIKHMSRGVFHIKETDFFIADIIKHFKETSLLRDDKLNNVLKKSFLQKLLNKLKYESI